MPKKTEIKKGTGCRINEGYVPSDYKYVEAILDEKAGEMLEKLYGKDWKDVLNGRAEPPEDKEG